MQKLWHQNNRVELRQKLIKKHEQNIELERKSGIKKKYVPVTGTKEHSPIAGEREDGVIGAPDFKSSEMDTTSFSRGLGFSLNSKPAIKQRPVSAYHIPMRSKLHNKTNTLAVENEIKETLSHEE